MRVSTKLALVTIAGVALVIASHGYGRVRDEAALFTRDMQRDHRTLAHGLALAAQTVADRSSIGQAVAVLEGANDREANITITWSTPSVDPAVGSVGWSSSIESDSKTNEDWLVTRVPLTLRGTPGILQMRESMGQERAHLKSILSRVSVVMLQLALLCTAVIVGAGWLFVARPMRELLEKVRRIGAGDLSTPLTLRYRDEIGELATELNAMCARLQSAQERAASEAQARVAAVEQIRHADRLSIVGRLASGVAHELGTPLNVVLAHAHMIARRGPQGDAAVTSAEVIAEQTERMASTIRQILNLARRETPRRQMTNLRELVARTLALLEPVAARSRVSLALRGEQPVDADVDAAQVQQVVANLVMNGIQAQPDGGEVWVELETDGTTAAIRVQDSGPGIPMETQERVFEPFFTTKDPGEGTGLGLTVSEGIVRDHGGNIALHSARDRGTSFRVALPVHAVATNPAQA